MAPHAVPAELIASAEAARQHGDWRAVRRDLRLAAEREPLPPLALEQLALATWWCGDIPEALRLVELAHQRLLAAELRAEAAECAATMTILALLRGDGALASGWRSRARRLLADLDESRAHGLVLYVDAFDAVERRELETAGALAFEVQQLGRRLAEPTLTALGLLVEGVARVRAGEVAAGLSLLDEAMLPVVGGQVLPEHAGAVYCMVIGVCSDLSDTPRARAWTHATERWAGQFSDALMFVGVCRVHRSMLRIRAGDLATAEREALRTCEELPDANIGVVAEGWYLIGECRRMRGDHAGAADAFERARALGRAPEPGSALLQLAQGRPDAARTALESARAETVDPFMLARLALARAEVALAVGRARDAAASADDLAGIAGTFASEGLVTRAAHARGMAELAAQRPADALEPLTAASHAYEAEGAPAEAARIGLLLARCHRALGRSERADAIERSSRERLAQLGLETGGTGDEPLPAGLSEREAEVLVRIAAGDSNRQAAQALRIAEKTVGRHLSNIYLKLDVHSRTAAAAWAHEQRLQHRMG